MKTDLPQSFRRLEYHAPNYTFSQVELDIALDPARTIVKSRLEVLPGAGHEAGTPLVLQGHELEFVSCVLMVKPTVSLS
jgi:aminopeptidase N